MEERERLKSAFDSDLVPDIMIHMLKAWPSVLARKSLQAREQLLILAFEKYFAENSYREGKGSHGGYHA